MLVDKGKELRMHDIIEDMGKEAVRQKAPSKLDIHSRLWFHQDVVAVLIGHPREVVSLKE